MSMQYLTTILEAKESKNLKAINEASLNRVLHHVQQSGQDGSFGIITSWRAGQDQRTNFKNFSELQHDLRSNGLGFFKLKGQWPESQDPNIPYDQATPDQIVMASEPSLFVPSIPKELIKTLMKKYTQDAVVYSGPETEGKVFLLKNDGSETPIGVFNPNTIASAYSSVKGKPFAFEYFAQTWSERLVESLFLRK